MFTEITKTTSTYRYKLICKAYGKWLKPQSKVLDIGCGNGIITKLLRDEFLLKIVGCDIKNYLIYKIPFMKIKDGQLPKTKNKFDMALLTDVLHHIILSQQEELILEYLKSAKKILIFEAKPTLVGKLADIVLNKYHYGDLKTPLAFRTVKQWQNLFRKLGLKYSTYELKSPFWYPFSHIAFEIQKL